MQSVPGPGYCSHLFDGREHSHRPTGTDAARTPSILCLLNIPNSRSVVRQQRKLAPRPSRRLQFHCLKGPLKLKQVPGTGVGDLSRRSHTESLTHWVKLEGYQPTRYRIQVSSVRLCGVTLPCTTIGRRRRRRTIVETRDVQVKPPKPVGYRTQYRTRYTLQLYLLIILVLECSLAVLVVVLVESELDSKQVSTLEIEGTDGDAIFFEFDNIDSRK